MPRNKSEKGLSPQGELIEFALLCQKAGYRNGGVINLTLAKRKLSKEALDWYYANATRVITWKSMATRIFDAYGYDPHAPKQK